MPIPFEFDFRNPDYIKVFEYRLEKYEKIKKKPQLIPKLKEFYRENPAQFIIDWGCTEDPRNAEKSNPAVIPFLLFECQEEWVNWFVKCWKEQKPGVTDKSREMGVTWIAMATCVTLCLFNEGLTIGVGSRKEVYVDKLGDPKCLLYKVRRFMSWIPPEFRGSWDIDKHAPHMRVEFPDTHCVITGESGDNMARGGRYSLIVLDESAWIPRPELIEASMAQATNCRMDISTPWGFNNPFARKVHNPNYEKRRLHWRQDPRKDEAWYNKKCEEINDPVVIAQELDLSYSASVEGVVIPAIHVQAAIDAHLTLDIKPTGIREAALDVADQGRDLNAFCGRHGILLEYLDEWSGVGSDTFHTVTKAFSLATLMEYDTVWYDADGMGSWARGDSRKINSEREYKINFLEFHGLGKVVNPEDDPNKPGEKGEKRTNENFFANYKAQAWWALKRRFAITYRAVVAKRSGEEYDYDPDDLISIPKTLGHFHKLVTELSQPMYTENKAGKILVVKTPKGSRSPNLADSVMMIFSPKHRPDLGFFDAW